MAVQDVSLGIRINFKQIQEEISTMSFDSLTLHHITHELSQTLISGSIRHIEQANPTTFNFKISKDTQIYWLTISAHSVHARAHLINKPSPGQKQSYFADFLSTHLKHGTIINVEQLGYDRILKVTVQPTTDEPIQPPPKAIIAEFMGKHSNIILIDSSDDRILECLKHIDETMSRFREVLPGDNYVLPPQQERIDLLTIDKDTFSELFITSEVTWKTFFNQIDGLSPTLAKEIIVRSEKTELWDAFQQVIAYFDSKAIRPNLLTDGDDPVAAYPLELQQYPNASSQPYASMSDALSAYYDAITHRETIASEIQTLTQALEKQRSMLDRKETALQRDLERAEKSEDYKIQGELLLANLHKISRGQTQVEIENYYSPDLETLTIKLNPEQSPSDNAQSYFKDYTKAKRGYSQIQQRLAEVDAEQKVLSRYKSKLESAKTLESLQEFHRELLDNGYLKAQKQKKKQQDTSDGPYRKYMSKNGFLIYVGRNSQSNDLLLREIAKPRDMWLHAKQIHGSHVIIRNPENRPDIPMPTLLQAAQLAAFYSKAHHSSYVPVDYTWAKYVVKRKGNVAGYVHYTHEKTLYVEPAVPESKNK